jgi:regulator of extracellular matrix RemA (YlzA/DUF370 family)
MAAPENLNPRTRLLPALEAESLMPAVLVQVGFGNYVAGRRIVRCQRPGSAPVQRLIRAAKSGRYGRPVIDVTSGRPTKAVMFIDTGQLVLSAMTPEAIAGRVDSARAGDSRRGPAG